MKFLLALLTTVPLALAHFTLDFPPTIGFDEDQEPNAPCGGFNPIASNVTAWPLTGGQIALDSHHPEMTILYRAQLMGASNWTNLTDGFLQMTGLGELCITIGSVPSDWSNKIGVIQVIGQPPDGILYQVHLFFDVSYGSVLESTLQPEHLEVHCALMERESL
jgi:hypothetical protein